MVTPPGWTYGVAQAMVEALKAHTNVVSSWSNTQVRRGREASAMINFKIFT